MVSRTQLFEGLLALTQHNLDFNPGFFIPLFKSLFGIIFCILFKSPNNYILDKNNPTEFSFEAIKSEIRFHTNPGLSLPSFEHPCPVHQKIHGGINVHAHCDDLNFQEG